MKKIIVSAPGKLMLLGEHAVVYDRPCIVTAVDQRLSAEIFLTESGEFSMHAPDVSITDYKKSLAEIGKGEIPKAAAFIERALVNFKEKYPFDEGLEVRTKSEFSSSFGFGSSSASTVCLVKALSEVFEKNLSDKEIFDLSYKTVLDVQGVGSGFDIAAAVYGGTVYFLTGGKKIEPLHVKDFDLVVGYSGTKADTTTIVKEIAKKRDENKPKIDGIFSEIEVLVEKGKICMNESDWEGFGRIMNENQTLLSQLGVSTEKLDAMIEGALSAGAYGAKLSGAGGGDCMIALCPKEKIEDVKSSIKNANGEIIEIKVNTEGVSID